MVEVLDKVEEHQYLEIHRERNDDFHYTRQIIPVLLSLIQRGSKPLQEYVLPSLLSLIE